MQRFRHWNGQRPHMVLRAKQPRYRQVQSAKLCKLAANTLLWQGFPFLPSTPGRLLRGELTKDRNSNDLTFN